MGSKEELAGLEVVAWRHVEAVVMGGPGIGRRVFYRYNDKPSGGLGGSVALVLQSEAADHIDALEAKLLAAEKDRDDLQQESWGLQSKVAALSVHETCACSWDAPDDLCMHHSPKLLAAEARLAVAEKALERLGGMEAMTTSHAAQGPSGKELGARIDFARQALSTIREGR